MITKTRWPETFRPIFLRKALKPNFFHKVFPNPKFKKHYFYWRNPSKYLHKKLESLKFSNLFELQKDSEKFHHLIFRENSKLS